MTLITYYVFLLDIYVHTTHTQRGTSKQKVGTKCEKNRMNTASPSLYNTGIGFIEKKIYQQIYKQCQRWYETSLQRRAT